MRRVVVLGGPGAGKSTFARALGTRIGVPVVHLDRLFHAPRWIPRPAETFLADVERAHAGDRWVSEGQYRSSWPLRFARADTLIFLDPGAALRLSRVLRRIATHYGRVRPDVPEGCVERFDPAFLRYVVEWRGRPRAETLAAVREAAAELDAHVLRSRRKVAAFMAGRRARPRTDGATGR